MKNVSQSCLSSDEQQFVTDAVHKAELRTSGEIVPMIVSQSDSYPLAKIRGSFLFALPVSLLVTAPVASMFWLESTNMWVFLSLFLPLFWGAMQVIHFFPAIKRYLLSREDMETEVQETALAAFFTERLYKTKDANGILIFISLLERRVWVIADSGISDRIPQERWQEAVSVITLGMRQKKRCQALCQAIGMIGDILEKEFPIGDDDHNELHDLIIR
ncbi:MAG: hypothetical protein KJ804_08800 [Proteobacteria bacterium]|nr:hypothetical protein [Pseudomonadota bacterium]MBU1058396.1 hypothetical protein [Pseudomonadota bacterium]